MAVIYELFANAFELIFPVAFAAFVLLRRTNPFPSWAKILAIGVAAAGLVVAALNYLLPHYRELGMTTDSYIMLMHFRRTLAGVVIGIVISILVSCARTTSPRKRESAV